MSDMKQKDADRKTARIFQLDLLQERVDVEEVPVDRIRPGMAQPRELLDPAGIEELAASIDRNGLLQPILVRPTRGGELELIAGERRWRAVRLLGLPSIPARVLHHVDDTTAAILGLVENVDREGLTAWEEAQAVAALRTRLSASGRPSGGGELARLCGWSEAKVSERLTIAEAITLADVESAGLDVHAVKKLPKSLLLNVSRLVNNVDRMGALAAAVRGVRGRAGAARRSAGRPRAPFVFRAPKSGRVSFQLRRPVSELAEEDARALLDRLEPLVTELRQRSGETAGGG
jgi:ParB/RepB/Spo0J family partition protein